MRSDIYNMAQQMPSSEVKRFFLRNNGDLSFTNTSASLDAVVTGLRQGKMVGKRVLWKTKGEADGKQ